MVRDILINKYGKSFTIKKLLYKELESIKRNDRDWVTTVEATEQILRQLKALGDNLKHPSIENTIESRLANWILEGVYRQREEHEACSVKNSDYS